MTNPFLGRPTPVPMPEQFFHPEAQAWRARVIANGGTFNTSTLAAVSRFCFAVDAAGIRDRFYRLNLLCGDNLQAALVPLYRGPVAEGPQYGNAADTNTNFVSADYVPAGARGGLTRLSATPAKSLSTGISPANAPQFATGHLAMSYIANSFVSAGIYVGYGTSASGGSHTSHYVGSASTATSAFRIFQSGGGDLGAPAIAGGTYSRWILNRSSSTLGTVYRNGGTLATTSYSTSQVSNTFPLTLFLQGAFGLHYYSLGDSFTNSQAATFDSLLSNFLVSLGRT